MTEADFDGSLADGAHVWLASVESPRNAGLESARLALLDGEERAACARIRRAELRARYALGHALLRCTLSRYADVEPVDWRFVRSPLGHPRVLAPTDHAGLRFSLSYSGDMAACAVVSQAEAGVDIEHLRTDLDVNALASRVFSTRERAALRRLDEESACRRFFEIWTLKEAYAKARGQGFGIAFPDFEFTFPEPGLLGAGLAGVGDVTEDWQFALYAPDESYRLALALRMPAGHPLRLSVFRASPPTALARRLNTTPCAHSLLSYCD